MAALPRRMIYFNEVTNGFNQRRPFLQLESMTKTNTTLFRLWLLRELFYALSNILFRLSISVLSSFTFFYSTIYYIYYYSRSIVSLYMHLDFHVNSQCSFVVSLFSYFIYLFSYHYSITCIIQRHWWEPRNRSRRRTEMIGYSHMRKQKISDLKTISFADQFDSQRRWSRVFLMGTGSNN